MRFVVYLGLAPEMRETLADSNRPEATCVGFREFGSTFFEIAYSGALWRERR